MHIRSLRGLLPALVLAALPAVSSAGLFVGVSVNIAPPELPVYVQPPCPEPGYLWSPGYWAWDDGAYYWVPGTWVEPPMVGYLWTPGYWGWQDGGYFWHAGYWGPQVGFYGGVDYGYGYDGVGFAGGYWRGRTFMYNRAVAHVGPDFRTNVYSRRDSYHGRYGRVSFNGGRGGVVAHPSRAQIAAARGHHVGFTSVQQRQQRMAFGNRSLRADYNHGRPAITATARPGVFRAGGSSARAAGRPMRTASMRSDRPPGASGQSRAGRPAGHAMTMQRQARPQQHFQQRPQEHQSFRPQARPQEHQSFRPQARPQEHQSFRPQARPQERQSFRPQARPQMQRQAPRPQQRGGGGGGGGRRPPENHGGGHNR